MERLISIYTWLRDNKEWVFSGIGVAILMATIPLLMRSCADKPDDAQLIPPSTSDSQIIENVDESVILQGENISNVNININNSQQISPTITPLPTQLPFAPATPDEALIIVPLYDDRSEGQLKGVNPSSQLYDLILKAAIENDESNVRVEYYKQVVDSSKDAQDLGEKYNAKIVFWGWYNNLKIQPYVEAIGKETVQGDGLPIVTSTPMAFYFLEEIPAQSAYLGLFMMGMTHFIVESENELYQAIRFFDAALDAVVVSTITNPWEAYIWRANCYLWLNEYPKALKDYEQGIRLNPDDAPAYFNRGIVYRELGEYKQAIQDYTDALRIDPDHAAAFLARGNAYAALGENKQAQNYNEQAIQNYSNALRINPDYVFALVRRGDAYRALEEDGLAIQDYTDAIQIDPDFVHAFERRGNAYGALGEFEKAIHDYTEVLRIVPDYAQAFLARGHAHYESKDYGPAIDDYIDALRLDPDNAFTYWARGNAYSKLSDNEKAIQDYNNALNYNALPDWIKKDTEQKLEKLTDRG